MNKKVTIPRTLKGEGRRYFKLAIQGSFDEIELPLLEATCRQLMAWDAAMKVIEKQGPLYKSTRGSKQRPEVTIARDAWKAFLAGVKALGLDASAEKPKKELGRPVDSRWTVQTGRRS